jgi:hypothetical protein
LETLMLPTILVGARGLGSLGESVKTMQAALNF